MQYEFFVVPAEDGAREAEELNRFLRGARVAQVERTFFEQGVPRWFFVVEYLDHTKVEAAGSPKGKRVDYKEILSEEDFTVFSQLRDLRKQLAQAEAVPVYTICTNEQLAAMVQNKVTTMAELLSLDGFGEVKARKYGAKLEVFLQQAFAS